MSEKQRGINIIVVGTGSNSVSQLIEIAENNKKQVLVVDNSKQYTIKAPPKIPELFVRDNSFNTISKRAERRKNKRKNK